MNNVREKLKNDLDRFQETGRTVSVFFRNDDVDEEVESLRVLLDLFLSAQTPLNLEITPGLMTEDAAALLRDRKSRHPELPDLIELNQHGWRHVNHEWHGRKCEFGPSRSFDQQFTDIAAGARILEDAFGEGFSRVFTPPWNRCTAETVDALKRLNFRALSRLDRGDSPNAELGEGVPEISVTLDLFRWRGGARMKTPRELGAELIAQLTSFGTVGVMLHHKVMDQAAFEWLAMLLAELRGRRELELHTFRSLLNK